MDAMEKYVMHLDEGVAIYARNNTQAVQKFHEWLGNLAADAINGHYMPCLSVEQMPEDEAPRKVTMAEVRDILMRGKEALVFGEEDMPGDLYYVDDDDDLRRIDIHSKTYSLVDLLTKELYIA